VSGATGPDPYLDPASGVLRNLLGITDPGELAQVEAALSASRLIDLERRRLPGSYDAGHHIDWIRMDPDRNVAASVAAHRGDPSPLTEMLGDLIDRPHPPGPPGPRGGRAA
jgi:hypothetical protein